MSAPGRGYVKMQTTVSFLVRMYLYRTLQRLFNSLKTRTRSKCLCGGQCREFSHSLGRNLPVDAPG